MSAAVATNAAVAAESEPLLDSRGLDVGHLLEFSRLPKATVVVVPVFNGGNAVARCLDALRCFTRSADVVVIDDASTDPMVIADLDRRAADGSVVLVRHDQNWGYTRTANQALQLGEGADVVLMNSDTEVGPGWLTGLQRVASSRMGVATVTALSDNAGAMAMPVAGAANAWPAHLSWAEIARAVAQAKLPWAIETPTGHGFCMLVTNEAIDRLEGFDVAAFPRGYGEENDFCMRAGEAGMVNLIAPRVFVRHVRSQSFGPEREELMVQGRAVVDDRHPTYTTQIRAWLGSEAMSSLRAEFEVLQGQLSRRDSVLPRRLYVLHRASGGTPATNLDLMTALSAYQDSYVLESVNASGLELSRVTPTGTLPLVTWEAPRPFKATDTWRQDYAEVAALLMVNLGIELVHVRHLINHPLTTMSDLTRRLDIPLVLSTHDFYLSCPTVHLLDEQDRYCGGTCTPGNGMCRLPTPFVQGVPRLKHSWIHEWRRRVAGVLDAADAIIATTQTAARTMASAYPRHAGSIRVIEHGRDLDRHLAPLRSEGIRLPGPPRIVAMANWDPHKGTEYLRELGRRLGPSVEWHVLGKRGEQLGDIATVHGPYKRESLRQILAEIDPDLSAVLSIWPETYSHTLTESWALGLPVLATDIGAVAERIRDHGGGILLPVDDPEAGAERIAALLADPAELGVLRALVPRSSVRTRAAMAESYRALYDEVEVGGRPHRIGYVVHGTLGSHPGSAHVRVLRRLSSVAVRERASSRQVFAREVTQGRALDDIDTLLVQRDAMDEDPDSFLAAVRASGVRLVLEVDDDLLHRDAAARMSLDELAHSARGARLSRLVEGADDVLVSTGVVAERLGHVSRVEPALIPNELDPRLWSRYVDPEPSPQRDEFRVLYMGTRTHLDDLLLLKPVVEQMQRTIGRRFTLEVVGVADSFDDDGWIKRLSLPTAMGNYPDFVQWLLTHRSRWHAAVAPLVESEFNRAKSDLKLLEYALLDLPTVASSVGPYLYADQLALLCENTTQHWVDALTETLLDSESAALRARTARGLVLAERMLSRDRIDRWLSVVLG